MNTNTPEFSARTHTPIPENVGARDSQQRQTQPDNRSTNNTSRQLSPQCREPDPRLNRLQFIYTKPPILDQQLSLNISNPQPRPNRPPPHTNTCARAERFLHVAGYGSAHRPGAFHEARSPSPRPATTHQPTAQPTTPSRQLPLNAANPHPRASPGHDPHTPPNPHTVTNTRPGAFLHGRRTAHRQAHSTRTAHPDPAQQSPTNTQPVTAPQYREPATAHKPTTPTHTDTQSPVPDRQLSSISRTSAAHRPGTFHEARSPHLAQQQPLNQQHPAGSYPSKCRKSAHAQPATTHERSAHDHQYSAGSFPSMSRTWVRAQVGHSQLCPRRSFSMTQANASTGGAPALERPQRAHSAAATSETGGLSTM